MPAAAGDSAVASLHARLEHFDWAHDEGCYDASECARHEGRVGVVNDAAYRACRGEAEVIVAGEVDYVCGDRHDEGWGEAAPKGGDSFVSRDFAEGVERRVECASLRFFECAVDGAHGVGRAESANVWTGDAVFDCIARVSGEEDFTAAGGDS